MNGDTVKIHYEVVLTETKKVIESTAARGEPRKLVVGKDKIAKGITKGLLAMKKGMKIKFTVSPEHAYGAKGISGVVPPNSEIDCIVELVDHHVASENKVVLSEDRSESDPSPVAKQGGNRRIEVPLYSNEEDFDSLS